MALKIDGTSIQKGFGVSSSLWGRAKGSRARIFDFSMVLRGWVGVRPWACAGALWRGSSPNPHKPKIKPNTHATGTGLGCLVSGFSPVHGPELFGVSPLTSTGAWAYGVCCLTSTHAVARSVVADLRTFVFLRKNNTHYLRSLAFLVKNCTGYLHALFFFQYKASFSS